MIKMIIAINDHGQSFYFKQTQLVVYKSDKICKDIQRESISLFPIWRLWGFPSCLTLQGLGFLEVK